MRVLLINPPAELEQRPSIPPLGLAYIAAVLRENGVDVEIIDYDLERERLRDLRREMEVFAPDIVGLGAVTLQIESVYAIAREVKELSSDIHVVTGGPHVSALPREVLEESDGCIDIVIVGEGEYALLEIVQGQALESISGIYFRSDERVVFTGARPPIADLDRLPMPARDLLKMDKYRGWGPTKKKPTTHLIASRGCPFDCVFCSEEVVFGRAHRVRSPDKVLEEVEILRDRYRMREVAFYDDLFTVKKDYVDRICEALIERKTGIVWKTLSRVDTVTPEMLEKMKRAGCWMIAYGFESGSQKILDLIKKKQTIQDSIDAANQTHYAGIKIYGFFMIGNIGETRDTVIDTIKLAQRLRPDYCQFTLVRPDPGSPLYNAYRTEIKAKKVSWREYYAFATESSKMPVVGTEMPIEALLHCCDVAPAYVSKVVCLRRVANSILSLKVRKACDFMRIFLGARVEHL